MHSVGRDSKVLSVLAKKRGGKGYRELQGEALRSMLFSLLKEEVCAMWLNLVLDSLKKSS
jgi:hypothetical protein